LRMLFRRSYQEKFSQTRTILNEKVKEALASVLPITIIVLLLCFSVAPVPTEVLLAFLMGAVMLIVGMGLFTLGVGVASIRSDKEADYEGHYDGSRYADQSTVAGVLPAGQRSGRPAPVDSG